MAMQVVKNEVTGQYLCGFIPYANHYPPRDIPTWGEKRLAIPASVEAVAKCHLAGIFCVTTEPA